MARDLYSFRIFAHASLTPAAGTVGPVVPSGLVYVLRDMDVRCDSAAAGDTLVVFNQAGGLLWVAVFDASINGFVYQWRGRQVYAVGEQVGFESFQGTWAIAASGYQLTTP